MSDKYSGWPDPNESKKHDPKAEKPKKTAKPEGDAE